VGADPTLNSTDQPLSGADVKLVSVTCAVNQDEKSVVCVTTVNLFADVTIEVLVPAI
jgi:hypothetical protein